MTDALLILFGMAVGAALYAVHNRKRCHDECCCAYAAGRRAGREEQAKRDGERALAKARVARRMEVVCWN